MDDYDFNVRQALQQENTILNQIKLSIQGSLNAFLAIANDNSEFRQFDISQYDVCVCNDAVTCLNFYSMIASRRRSTRHIGRKALDQSDSAERAA
jgi:hypothetical protein